MAAATPACPDAPLASATTRQPTGWCGSWQIDAFRGTNCTYTAALGGNDAGDTEGMMRAELRELDQAYKALKFAYEDQARLIGRPRRASAAELERAQDRVRAANDAFDAARRDLEAAVSVGVSDD